LGKPLEESRDIARFLGQRARTRPGEREGERRATAPDELSASDPVPIHLFAVLPVLLVSDVSRHVIHLSSADRYRERLFLGIDRIVRSIM
jgi:hypothetical protein